MVFRWILNLKKRWWLWRDWSRRLAFEKQQEWDRLNSLYPVEQLQADVDVRRREIERRVSVRYSALVDNYKNEVSLGELKLGDREKKLKLFITDYETEIAAHFENIERIRGPVLLVLKVTV